LDREDLVVDLVQNLFAQAHRLALGNLVAKT
jgi:hypothetical protein